MKNETTKQTDKSTKRKKTKPREKLARVKIQSIIILLELFIQAKTKERNQGKIN